jgi:hypothetical protein
MATLYLVKTDDGQYLLQGTGHPSRNADFSLFDVDGEGGDPFAWGNSTWAIVETVEGVEYDPEDTDSFWTAQAEIVEAAEEAGITLPDYAKK